jgi:hypothetical protein
VRGDDLSPPTHERRTTARDLEQVAAERVDVRARVGRVRATALLGRHVLRRPHHPSRTRLHARLTIAVGTALRRRLGPPPAVPVGTAPSGRPPDRTRRADFPHRAPTFGLRRSIEALRRPGVNDVRYRKWIPGFEALDLLDVPSRALAAPL